jgi:hypothetical protein
MGKFARSWDLFKQSGRVLMSDKQLLLLPILSSISCILVLATFALPLIFAVDWHAVMTQAEHSRGSRGGNMPMQPWYPVVLFAYYFANFFVITFFNSALIACAIRKFNGESATLKDGLGVAMSRLPQILAWSAVAATVGVLLQMLQERLGFIGKIILNLIGMVWTIATFFVVPVLVVEKVGPFSAVKRSVEILKKTWGESLITNIGIGAVTGVLVLVGLLAVIGGVVMSVMMNSPWPIAVIGALFVFYIVAIALISTTLKGILLAATYQYAATGVVPGGFNQDVLSQAFKSKAKGEEKERRGFFGKGS